MTMEKFYFVFCQYIKNLKPKIIIRDSKIKWINYNKSGKLFTIINKRTKKKKKTKTVSKEAFMNF